MASRDDKARLTSLATESRRPYNPVADATRRERGRVFRLEQAQREWRLQVFFPKRALLRQRERLANFPPSFFMNGSETKDPLRLAEITPQQVQLILERLRAMMQNFQTLQR